MALINLRAYNQEIEENIEQGLYDQAIAHCRNLLTQVPKHIDTYRLLGKAFLESQRYGDAADILQRVLSCIPEDFVAQVGMSIVREDEGNIDEAIWHMERAFEIQPANNAVQGELRRLYGRRDGIEPPKVNLTRGALARMYIKGDLFTQAIAELRMALAEDSSRLDLKVLLARAYFETKQVHEAIEICKQVLEILPNCYEANFIMAKLLTENNKLAEAQRYIECINYLDPYTQHLSETTPTPDLVVDSSVLVDKLENVQETAGSVEKDQPEWARSLGLQIDNQEINYQNEQEGIAEGLPGLEANPNFRIVGKIADDGNQLPTPTIPGEPVLEQNIMSDDSDEPILPDWMKEAGWTQSDSEKKDEGSIDLSDSDDALEPAEIPDWLQALAPPEEGQSSIIEEVPSENTPDVPWLDESPPGASDSIATWLKSLDKKEEPVQDEIPEEIEDIDWVTKLGDKSGIDTDIPLPDQSWEMNIEKASANEPSPSLSSINPVDDLPDWLKNDSETEESPTELPDWLKSIGEEDQEVVTDNSINLDLDQPLGEEPAETIEDTKPVFVKPHEGEESQVSAGVPSPDSEMNLLSAEDTEAAFAWLENLAVKQGADEALLLTPEERREEPPEWITDSIAGISESSEESIPIEPAVSQSTPQQAVEDEMPAWLQSSIDEPQSVSQVNETGDDELPEWLTEFEVTTSSLEAKGVSQEIDQLQPYNDEIETEKEIVEDIVETLPEWFRESTLSDQVPLEEELNDLDRFTSEKDSSILEPQIREELIPDLAQEFEMPEVVELTETIPIDQTDAFISRDLDIKTPTTNLIETAFERLRGEEHSLGISEVRSIINSRQELPEVIEKLNTLLYEFPMDISLWVLLGDALLRSDQLQPALDAYTKAENLMR